MVTVTPKSGNHCRHRTQTGEKELGLTAWPNVYIPVCDDIQCDVVVPAVVASTYVFTMGQ